MAESDSEACVICHSKTLCKLRRVITGTSFPKQILELLHSSILLSDVRVSDFMCNSCFNLCNKVVKLQRELETKLVSLQDERAKFMDNLLLKHSGTGAPVSLSAKPKRGISLIATPSPKTHKFRFVSPRAKAGPWASPSRQVRYSPQARPLSPFNPRPPSSELTRTARRKELKFINEKTTRGTQCNLGHVWKPTPPDFHVRIEVNYPSGIKHRLVKDENRQSLCKALLKDSSIGIATAAWNEKDVKIALKTCVLKELNEECSRLCAMKNSSLLANVDTNSLVDFSTDAILDEWKEKAPFFTQILATCVKKSSDSNDKPGLVTGGAVLLHARNQKLCRLHHCIGITLDHGGATDETVSLMHKMGVSASVGSVKKKKQELLSRQNEHINKGIKTAKTQMENISASSSLDLASDIARSLRNDEELIQSYHEDVLFRCSCGKTYQVKGWFKNHLQKIHGHSFTDEASLKAQAGVEPEKVLKSAFMRCALLFMDTNDAYAMGDGDRIFRNAKFEMLIDDAQGHTKYRLWLWRFLAYEKAILSPQLAMEYKWNATVNISGGVGRNIPCDNLVEIVVHRIKDKLRAQGANVTFKSALEASLSTQIADEIKNNLSTQYRSKPSGRRRTLADKSGDIAALVGQLMESKQFKDGQSETDCFKDFKDPFDRVDITEFVKWIQDQKDRASVEMILF